VDGRDVAVAKDRQLAFLYGGPIEVLEDAHRPVAPTRAEDEVYGFVVGELVEVFEPRFVRGGQIALLGSCEDAFSKDGLYPPSLEELDAGVDVLAFRHAGRGWDSYSSDALWEGAFESRRHSTCSALALADLPWNCQPVRYFKSSNKEVKLLAPIYCVRDLELYLILRFIWLDMAPRP